MGREREEAEVRRWGRGPGERSEGEGEERREGETWREGEEAREGEEERKEWCLYPLKRPFFFVGEGAEVEEEEGRMREGVEEEGGREEGEEGGAGRELVVARGRLEGEGRKEGKCLCFEKGGDLEVREEREEREGEEREGGGEREEREEEGGEREIERDGRFLTSGTGRWGGSLFMGGEGEGEGEEGGEGEE